MENEVKYTMSLNDLLTGKVKDADHAINKMEGSLHSAGGAAKHFGMELIGAIGIGVLAFKGFEFIEQGVHGMHELEQAAAQVKAGLASTGEAAGLTFEQLEDQAKSLANALPYSRSQIMDMQAQLLTFPSIVKETFGQASSAVLDMAARTHRGTNEIAIMVGKALQDPTKGVTALRRVGVNFNAEQTAIIKKLAETGHAAQAQAMILKELNLEFAGSAKAAANADPLFRYNKIMASIKLEVGEVAIKFLHFLTPALEAVANAFKAGIEWMKEHKDLIEAIAIGVGVAAAAFIVYEVAINAVTWATKAWTAVQWLLNAAMTANPIGILIVAIGVITSAVVYCYMHFAKFRAVLLGVWETIKEFGRIAGDIFTGLGKIIAGTLSFDVSLVKEGYDQTVGAISNAGNRLGQAFNKGFNEGMADFAKDHAEHTETAKGPKVVPLAGKTGKAGATAPAESGKATGQKNTVINIKIDSLIKDFQIKTTNIKEGIGKAKEMVAQALISAVNDSQIIAGQ